MKLLKYLCLAAIACVFAFNCASLCAREVERSAKVIMVKADVKIQKSGQTTWQAAKEGMLLWDGDTVKTGKVSAVELSFDKENKNLVRLEENSTAILRGADLKRIELPQGRIRSLVKSLKKETSFEIKTPTVVAGARGSGWDVGSSEKRDNVKAFEDEIFARSYDEKGNLIKEIIIREGWEVDIDRFQAPGELNELTDRDKSDWNSWREDLNGRLETGREGGEDRSGQFGNIESIEEKTAKQEDYKEQISETDDIKKIDDRIADENRPEPEPPKGDSGSQYEYP